MRRTAEAIFIVVLGTVLAGCLQHRASVLGRTALSGIGPKAIEASVSTGLLYSKSTDPAQVNGSRDVHYAQNTQFPAFEGNMAFGFSEKFGLNLHMSSAGIQPGLKILLLRRWISIAIQPEFSFLYWSYADKTDVTKDGYTNTTTTYDIDAFGVTFGTKVIASTKLGIYGGIGYDFQFLTYSGEGSQDSSALQHILSFGVGYEISIGMLRLRPELSITVTPSITMESEKGTSNGGWSLTIMPNVTVAVAGFSVATQVPVRSNTIAPALAPAP